MTRRPRERPLFFACIMSLLDISSRDMKQNAVTPVILGLLSLGPRSGYDIKNTVDRSTRFFWAASYGQIYPELRRLEVEGLIEGEDAPNGGGGRRAYTLPAAGRKALTEWLLGRAVTIELRDE